MDHFIEAADVGVHVGAHAYDFSQVLLDVSAKALPVFGSAAEGGLEVKVGMIGGELFEFVAVINILGLAGSEEEPELMILMAFFFGEQPVQHRAEGGDTGSSGDEDGVAKGRTESEISEGTLKGDGGARFEVAEMVGHESVLDAVEAEGDPSVFGGSRSDGVGTGDFFAFGRGGFYGEPLSRDKAEMRESGDFEFDVFGEFRERGRTENAGLEIFELGHFSI